MNTSDLRPQTVAFHTLGCKFNFSETSTIARSFTENGFVKTAFNKPADVYVLNTCSVTDLADKKCRQAVRKVVRLNPHAFVAVVGCYAQLKPNEIVQIPGVDIVLGVNEKFKLFEHIRKHQSGEIKKLEVPEMHGCSIDEVERFDAAFSSGDRTRSFLKVQDGCDYACTYCTIPLARGKSRNASISNTIKQAQKIAAQGFKEVILTGVNIGDFGRSTGENFTNLVKALDEVEGIERYRISSIEPNLLTNQIIEFTTRESKKFLPHFHIPLQSGSHQILKRMKRRYNPDMFRKRVEQIKSVSPQAFIGVDVIIGFPGETDELFQETYDFLDNLDISFLHVFTYSDRPNTPTWDMTDKVQPSVKQKRSAALHALSDKKHRQFYVQNLGSTAPVLFEEQRKAGKMFGFTDNYVKVEIDYQANLVNKIADIRLTEISESGNVVAEIL